MGKNYINFIHKAGIVLKMDRKFSIGIESLN